MAIMKKQKKYYFLHCVEDIGGIGYAPADEDYEFFFMRDRLFSEWTPISFHLKDGGFVDYQPNDVGWSLCSKKLKDIIQQNASPNDIIQWLEIVVIGPESERRNYYVLHFPESLDVLDKKKTVFAAENVVVKPYLDLESVGKHRVFKYQGTIKRFVVSEEVKAAILKADCIGIEFSKVPQ